MVGLPPAPGSIQSARSCWPGGGSGSTCDSAARPPVAPQCPRQGGAAGTPTTSAARRLRTQSASRTGPERSPAPTSVQGVSPSILLGGLVGEKEGSQQASLDKYEPSPYSHTARWPPSTSPRSARLLSRP